MGLPQPLTRRRVCLPPLVSLVSGGGAHSLAMEGVGESQFRRGDIRCGTLYIYVLFANISDKYYSPPEGMATIIKASNTNADIDSGYRFYRFQLRMYSWNYGRIVLWKWNP